ncbi:glycosyltransferase family 4 protein [Agromyces silvae]|uniref:glycosyltransferase family 4 protein n=1 Tax=Agromyces silvae TaxID=3388266 RepID=UPI00280C39BC|nr:glycosyltransferase family 4 protein [Agromyces protaetiae]
MLRAVRPLLADLPGARALWTQLRSRRLRAAVARESTATYANGVSTAFTLSAAKLWHLERVRPVVIVLLGPVTERDSDWILRAHEVLRAHILVSERLASEAVPNDDVSTRCDFLGHAEETDLRALLMWVRRHWRACDVWLLDTKNPLPDHWAGVHLQHVAHEYHEDAAIGIVQPALTDGRAVYQGPEYDRAAGGWSGRQRHDRFLQYRIPRYVLGATVHGTLLRADAIDAVDLPSDELEGASFTDQLNVVVRRAWQQNRRTLAFSPVVLAVTEPPVSPAFTDAHRTWLEHRTVTNAAGRRRVIFVLNATSVSGGIRVVFAEAAGLAARGFDVEIWSLQGTPGWIESSVPVTSYRRYEDLLLALRNERAIKVATWWETSDPVFLASVNHGIPVNFVQEFETWFYPDQPWSRSAVATSYRPELLTLTTAQFQRAELAELGVDAALIPVGFDPTTFFVDQAVSRERDVVLAVGRSFFQKNFAMTRRAWDRLGDARPKLLMYGNEPDLVEESPSEYVVRPDDAGVQILYNRATCFVQTSIHEGFGLPILEAMACGCPVITTDAHGNRDFCVDGENCLIVPQDDDVALAGAIRRLLADEALQERLRAGGLRTAERYAWPVVLDELADFYRAVD